MSQSQNNAGAQNAAAFVFDTRQWITEEMFTTNVNRIIPMDPENSPYQSLIKKVERAEEGSAGQNPPHELTCLNRMQDSNRIVKPVYAALNPFHEDGHHTWNMLFEEYELGDVMKWRTDNFTEVAKLVPEAHLWRYLVHMTQALAMVHGHLGAKGKPRGTLIHGDIKPENVLVSLNGNAYPSFKLHDFGLARVAFGREDRREPAFHGTFVWQPPEAPHVKTTFADIWAMGAVLHYLAFDELMIPARTPNWLDQLDDEDEEEALKWEEDYSSGRAWYDAMAPRLVSPINLGKPSKVAEVDFPGVDDVCKPKYSDRLNYWMMQCLEFDPFERVTIKRLMEEMIPEARTKLMDLGGEKALVDFELVFE